MAMPFPADYLGVGYYPPDIAPPLVDHLHQRHFHQSLATYFTHRKPNHQAVMTQPDLDIRCTNSGYIIDIELPGVSDKNSVSIEWTSSRNLVLSGKIERPSAPEETQTPAGVQNVKNAPNGTRGNDGEYISPKDASELSPTLVVMERKIGPFQRHFSFPDDVDVEKMKAKLESGLLVISVPKKMPAAVSRGRLHIE